MLNACTIIACNYLPFARVLANSLLLHHPDARFTVLLIDDEERRISSADERVRYLRLSDLDLDPAEVRRLAGIYDVTELATAVKPLLLSRLLDDGAEDAIYLDPDIKVYDVLDHASVLAREHGIVLTPHTMRPFPKDDRRVDGLFILAAGVYNLGFIGVSGRARPFLDWWWQTTRRHAIVDVTRNLFTDQRWIDYVPCFFDHAILKDPGYNVAYWNLHARELTTQDGAYRVDGQPLRFFHFSGFNIKKPWLLSKYQEQRPRVLLSEHPSLSRLCRDYAEAVEEAGGVKSDQPYGWSRASCGLELTTRMRRLYREAVLAAEGKGGAEPPNPFDAAHPGDFVAWLNQPETNGVTGVSRYIASIHADRLDLQIQFPALDGPDAARFINWLWRDSDISEAIPPELLPIEPVAFSEAATAAESPRLSEGVCVAGYFRAELGIGEAGRALVRALEHAAVPHSTVTYDATLSRQLHGFSDRTSLVQYDIKLLCVNADSTAQFARSVGPSFFTGRHTIGYWFWELGRFPATMNGAFAFVDEVWTATDYVAGAIRSAGHVPVYTIPLAVRVPQPAPSITRASFGLPDRYIFLFSFDFLSIVERKNPLGLVRAFMDAFQPDEGPVLVLKSINGHLRLNDLEQLRFAVADRPDIRVIDDYYTSEERDSLLTLSDCYVSLHRSEGFGLTMAEAMALGKPVIATGYSGNLQFMTADNSFLVNYSSGKVPAGCDPYPEGVEWADPDLSHASSLMRLVFERPDLAAAVGRKAESDIRTYQSVEVAGAAIVARLDRIRRQRKDRIPMPPGSSEVSMVSGTATGPSSVAPLEALLPQLDDLVVPRLTASGRWSKLRLAVQRLLFRVLRPYALQQQLLHRQIIAGLRQTALALREEQQVLHRLDRRGRVLARELSATRREVHRLGSSGGRAETSGPRSDSRETSTRS